MRPKIVLGLLAAALSLAPGAPAEPPAAGCWRNWKTLRLETSSFFLRGNVEVKVDERADRTSVEVSARAKLMGAGVSRLWARSVLDSASGRALEHVYLQKRRARRFVFGTGSYSVERLEPQNDPKAPLDRWTVRSHRDYPYPPDAQTPPGAVLDYYSMLLHLRRLPLHAPGDEAVMTAATSDGPREFRVKVAESRQTERSFIDLATGRERTVALREFRLLIVPTDPKQEGFLRMKGQAELWVEAESKTPVAIYGKIPKLPGHIDLKLAAIG